MRRYETICIIRPGASEDEVTAIIERSNGIIEAAGGKIDQLDRWGLKKLAYPISKETQGYYVFTEYAGMPEAVNEIERLFRIDDKVLKYLTVKTQEVYGPKKERPVREINPETAASNSSDDE
ncbi:MAG: 30S ribosomal protein S6 [Desulfobacteraceae bacterium]|nr:30S ribosomal protein S6 [Desulfobacteraceae bacterium]